MAINVRKALAIIQKDLAKTWKKLDFDYEIVDNDEIKVKSSVTLTNVDDDILIIINVYSSGRCGFRAVFDKIEKTGEALYLVNQFNDERSYFKAYIREDGYLEFKHLTVCYDLKNLVTYASDFLYEVAELADVETVTALGNLTQSA